MPATLIAPTHRHGPWQQLQPWIALQELPKHLANIFPFLLGTALAWWYAGVLNWPVLGWTLVGIYLLTNGTYVSNEVFDYENDRLNATRIGGADAVGVTTTGGTRVLVKGLIRRRAALAFAVACFALSIPVGLWLRYGLGTGPLTIPLGLLGLFIGWFYTAPPIRACYRGWGELFIGVGQGLVVFGAFYMQQGWHPMALVVSLPWFIALPALKIIREFPDYAADAATGKRGLVVAFGQERMAPVYSGIILLSVLAFVPVWFVMQSPWFALVVLPVVFLLRSASITATGCWRDPKQMETAAVTGFIGMLLIPVSLTIAFVLAARW